LLFGDRFNCRAALVTKLLYSPTTLKKRTRLPDFHKPQDIAANAVFPLNGLHDHF
jgi:hypothetical protein